MEYLRAHPMARSSFEVKKPGDSPAVSAILFSFIFTEILRSTLPETDASFPDHCSGGFEQLSQAKLKTFGHFQDRHPGDNCGLTGQYPLFGTGADPYQHLACAAVRIPAESP